MAAKKDTTKTAAAPKAAKKKAPAKKKVEAVSLEEFNALKKDHARISKVVGFLSRKLETLFGQDFNADGKIGIILLCLSLGLAGVARATDVQVIKAPEGQSARMEIHADEGDDAADELALEIDTSGSATIEVGGTDAITIDSSGNVTFSGTIGGTPSAGTVSNATTVTGTEVYGTVNKTVLVADDLPVVLAEGGTGTNGYGSAAIYAFPEGRIFVLGVTVDSVTVTVDTNALDNADGGDFAFGTAAAGGTSGLSGTEVDLCPSTSIDPITNVVSAALADAAQFDGTSTAKLMYFNHEVDDADIAAACTNTVDFTATVHWINLGDY